MAGMQFMPQVHSDASQTAKHLSEECSLEATRHYEVPERSQPFALQWSLRLIKMSMNNTTLSTY
jgi:Tfp pilus assembly protein PilP